jgi:hypothetical protein
MILPDLDSTRQGTAASVPRWNGDVNFMPVFSETMVMSGRKLRCAERVFFKRI